MELAGGFLNEGVDEGKSFDNANLCASDGGEATLLHSCAAVCVWFSCMQENQNDHAY